MQAEGPPLDWYRTSFSEAFNAMSWDEDDEHGERCAPSTAQRQLYVEATRR